MDAGGGSSTDWWRSQMERAVHVGGIKRVIGGRRTGFSGLKGIAARESKAAVGPVRASYDFGQLFHRTQ
jgi:hypothetical protein